MSSDKTTDTTKAMTKRKSKQVSEEFEDKLRKQLRGAMPVDVSGLKSYIWKYFSKFSSSELTDCFVICNKCRENRKLYCFIMTKAKQSSTTPMRRHLLHKHAIENPTNGNADHGTPISNSIADSDTSRPTQDVSFLMEPTHANDNDSTPTLDLEKLDKSLNKRKQTQTNEIVTSLKRTKTTMDSIGNEKDSSEIESSTIATISNNNFKNMENRIQILENKIDLVNNNSLKMVELSKKILNEMNQFKQLLGLQQISNGNEHNININNDYSN